MTITTQKTTETRWDIIRSRVGNFITSITTVFNVGLALLVVSLATGIYGYWVVNVLPPDGAGWNWSQFFMDYYANISSEAFSVAITVLIIDTLNRRRAKQEERGRLIRQMGNKENGIALQAAEELRGMNAHKDGSLRGIELEGANLHTVRLGAADLRGARMDFSDFSDAQLFFANLERADMSGVNFQGAALTNANLRDTNLVAANLSGALLLGADMTNAKIEKAVWSEDTQLPDNTRWRDSTDLTRFTDPTHPQYWRSDMTESPAYSGGRRGRV